MKAAIGDRVHTHGVTSSRDEHTGEIVQVRGADGRPPYLVRFPNGEERLIYPGPHTVVEPRESAD